MKWNCHQAQDTEYFGWGKSCAKLFQQMPEYRNAQNILNFTSIFIGLWKYIQVFKYTMWRNWKYILYIWMGPCYMHLSSELGRGHSWASTPCALSSNSGSCLEESGVVVSACHLSSREAETGGSPGFVSLLCLVSSRTVTDFVSKIPGRWLLRNDIWSHSLVSMCTWTYTHTPHKEKSRLPTQHNI